MTPLSRRLATAAAIVVAVAAGYWGGHVGSIRTPQKSSVAGMAQPTGPVIYYKDPNGRPFYSLTPRKYRKAKCPKWPGPLFVTGWWILTTALLPIILSSLTNYDLTYGSLAGAMIALIFFFVVGLGLVIGAELNAALAEAPENGLEGAQDKETVAS